MRLGGLKEIFQFFAFIFQLSGGALVASSCFALQVPDVRG